MHSFDDLIHRSTSFTLQALEKANNELIESLQEGASTTAVKNLQMVQFQKVILATGMFSLFDATLQEALACSNGFARTKEILIHAGEDELHSRFKDFIGAINVLKHGKGQSYDSLISRIDALPFRIKLPDQNFFFEGDVSEVSTLIEVTDTFVMDCAELIYAVCTVVRREVPDLIL